MKIRPFPCAIVFALLASATASASIININVVTDNALFWHAYLDWTQPSTSSSYNPVGVTTNWSVALFEVPVGGGQGVLFVSAAHATSPHEPPFAPGLVLNALFGPLLPGASAPPVSSTQTHPDDPGDYDRMVVSLSTLDATTSRLDIQLSHLGVSAASASEPGTITLALGAALLLGGRVSQKLRRRR